MIRHCLPRLPALAASLLLLLCAGCAGGSRNSLSGAQCLADLSGRAAVYQTAGISEPADSRCTIDTAVRANHLALGLSRPAVMSCALADWLDRFEHEAVEPIAQSDLGQSVTRVDHLGSFSCRAQSSGRTDRLSQHAYGNAIDIGGFRLADGSTVNVERDWRGGGAHQLFLRHVAQAACRYFSVVLTPDSNLEHYNHFHIDIGPGRLCSGA